MKVVHGEKERGGPASFALRAALFAGIWLTLAGGEPSSLVVGLPAIAAALWVGWPRHDGGGCRIRVWRMARFVVFFFVESLRGGIDVAMRTITRVPRLSCGWIDYRTSLPHGGIRVFFATVVGLLPGTLAVDMDGDTVVVHTLDDTRDTELELRRVENVVAELFGIPLRD